MNEEGKMEHASTPPKRRNILAFVWIISILLALYPLTRMVKGSFPIFTFLFLIIPLIALVFSRDAASIGIRSIKWGEFLKYTALCLVGTLGLSMIFELWSHTYQMLLSKALSSASADITFGWLVRYPGTLGWILFFLFAGMVSLFAEELFFRGWLLNTLKLRMSGWKAILLQAILFTLPQLLAAFLLPLTQGILYGVVYSFLTIGLMGGWVAHRTRSIWPSLVSAALYNLIMCLYTFTRA